MQDYLGFPIVPPGVPTSDVCMYPKLVGITTVAQTGAIIENVAACVARCDSTPGCIAISHYADRNCWFLKSTISARAVIPTPGAVFYYKNARKIPLGQQCHSDAFLAAGCSILMYD